MTVKDDLLAARALIDTAETAKDPINAWFAAKGTGGDVSPMCDALDAAVPEDFKNPSFGLRPYYMFCKAHSHSDVLALFDRAINAA